VEAVASHYTSPQRTLLTIGEVNQLLDDLASAPQRARSVGAGTETVEAARVAVLQRAAAAMTARDQVCGLCHLWRVRMYADGTCKQQPLAGLRYCMQNVSTCWSVPWQRWVCDRWLYCRRRRHCDCARPGADLVYSQVCMIASSSSDFESAAVLERLSDCLWNRRGLVAVQRRCHDCAQPGAAAAAAQPNLCCACTQQWRTVALELYC
jgi:hypothetical protein